MVQTSDVRGAGTDANVYIVMKGSKSSLGETRLEARAKDFERGSSDAFMVKAQELGSIEEIELWHDAKGEGGAWGRRCGVWVQALGTLLVGFCWPSF